MDGVQPVAIIDGSINSLLYQKSLKENFWPSVCVLKLECYAAGKGSEAHKQIQP